MNALSALFLSIVILAQSVVGTLVVVHYQANKRYIAKTLCENRSKPNKKCEGKCYLKKQLKKAEEAEKTLPGTVKEKMESPCVILSPLELSFIHSAPPASHSSFYSFFIPEGSSSFEPHPPRG